MIKFNIPFQLPSLNKVTKSNRTHWAVGATQKEETEEYISWELKRQNIQPIDESWYPITLKYTWIENSWRGDWDNIVMARKMILDSLVSSGIIINDSKKYVNVPVDKGIIDKNRQTEVIVEIYPNYYKKCLDCGHQDTEWE